MAETKEKTFHYGGQAVIEGVMMRGPKDFAVAARDPNGEIISTRESIESVMGRFKWLDRPFLRGTLQLIDSMALGMKALKFSADVAMNEAPAVGTETPGDDGDPVAADPPKTGKVNDIAIGAVLVLSLVLSVALFKLVPIILTKPLNSVIHERWQLTTIEGLVKIAIFIAYVLVISLMKDIRRVFQYHGAEHKTINAYEAGEKLTVDSVTPYTKVHVRCGTSFILVVLVSCIVVGVLVTDHLPHGSLTERTFSSYFIRWLYQIALLPFVAGIAYEVIRYAGKHKDSFLARLLVFPGLLMQRITTREPEPEMIEVAITSLQSVLDYEASQKVESASVTPDTQNV